MDAEKWGARKGARGASVAVAAVGEGTARPARKRMLRQAMAALEAIRTGQVRSVQTRLRNQDAVVWVVKLGGRPHDEGFRCLLDGNGEYVLQFLSCKRWEYTTERHSDPAVLWIRVGEWMKRRKEG